MPDKNDYQLPVWAYRLRKSQIEQLYKSTAQGLLDEELIDDVGFSLYARCQSMIQVAQASIGKPPCPNCDAIAELDKAPWDSTAVAACPTCGWTCPWGMYKKTYQRKGLFMGGFKPAVEEFVREFAITKAHAKRLVLIDTLIHRFHWESKEKAGGRPGATSLIEGKMKDIMAFLDSLSYDDNVPPEIEKKREEWRRKWHGSPWSQGQGQ